MAEPDGPERFEIRITDIEDPCRTRRSAVSVAMSKVARPDGLDEPFVLQLLVLGLDRPEPCRA